MFRQILVHPTDRDWQCILWRADPSETLGTYRLNTVTYGTASAPFLALRVLRQLALDEGERFPLGSQVLLEHSYVDDLLAGAHQLGQAREVQETAYRNPKCRRVSTKQVGHQPPAVRSAGVG